MFSSSFQKLKLSFIQINTLALGHKSFKTLYISFVLMIGTGKKLYNSFTCWLCKSATDSTLYVEIMTIYNCSVGYIKGGFLKNEDHNF
jgi:hypothetical protein